MDRVKQRRFPTNRAGRCSTLPAHTPRIRRRSRQPPRGYSRAAGLGERPTSIAEPSRAPHHQEPVRGRPSRRERRQPDSLLFVWRRERGAAPQHSTGQHPKAVRLSVEGSGIEVGRRPTTTDAGGNVARQGLSARKRSTRRRFGNRRPYGRLRTLREREKPARTGRRQPDNPLSACRCSLRRVG